MREGRVVGGPGVLLQHEGLPAQLDGQGLAHGQEGGGRGDRHGTAGQPGDVGGVAGEGHGRVQGDGHGAGPLRGGEHVRAVAPGGVDHQLAGPPRPDVGQAADEPGELVVGHGEQD